MPDDISIALKFLSDSKDAQTDIKALDARVEEIKKTTEQLNQKFENVQQVSTRMAAAGAAIFGPALLSAQAYVNAVGKTEEVSRKFIAAQDKQKEASLAFGRKAAEALLPYENALTQVLNLISRVDPRILEAGIAIGGGLVLVGAIGTLTAQIGIFTAQSIRLISTLNANFMQGGLASRAAIAGGAIAVGTGAGIGITRAIGTASGDQRLANYGLSDAVKTLVQATVAAAESVGSLAKIVPLLEYAIQTGAGGVKNALQDLIDNIKEAVLGLEKGLAGANFSILGKKVDLGKALGIDAKDIDAQIAALEKSKQARKDERESIKAIASQDLAVNLDAIDKRIDSFQKNMLNLADSMDKTSTSASKAAQSFDTKTLDAFAKYQDEQKSAETTFNTERLAKQRAFEADFKKSETDFNRARDKEAKSFSDKERQAITQFNQQQAAELKKFQADQRAAVVNFAQEQARQAADHQEEDIKRVKQFAKDRQRAEEDSHRTLVEAAGRLDAIAVLHELQSRETGRKRTQEDFNSETEDRKKTFEENRKRALEDFQKQQQDQQRQFQEGRQASAAQFRERQVQERQQFDANRRAQLEEFRNQQSLRRQAFNAQMADDQSKYSHERQLRQAVFRDALDQLNGWGRYEVTARRAYYAQLVNDLNNFIRSTPSLRSSGNSSTVIRRGQFSIAQFADGGYSGSGGIAQLHQDEFVANAATTRALERFAGAPLTQERISNAVTNNRSMGNVTIHVNGANDPQATAKAVRQEFGKLLQELT